MADRGKIKRYAGENHEGSAHASPYPVSRMAPATEIVDLAREIAEADEMLAHVNTARMRLIAEQMRHLRQEARDLLERARRDRQLHRARCNFQRRPGKIYHLYRRDDGEECLSMLAPDEWLGRPPHTFLGSFRLEPDMSWTPVEEIEPENAEQTEAARLLAALRDAGGEPDRD